MAYPKEIKSDVLKLREAGFSINEISNRTTVPKATLSLWLRSFSLSKGALVRLDNMRKLSRLRVAQSRKNKTNNLIKKYLDDATKNLEDLRMDKTVTKLLCAMIYYCEGIKNTRSCMMFSNSDPKLVASFLKLLRSAFDIKEGKFRVCIHLHGYHNQDKQLDFWSKITSIPRKQFIKPFLKKNTGKRKRENYQGCASIRYYDTNLSRQLLMIAKAFIGGT